MERLVGIINTAHENPVVLSFVGALTPWRTRGRMPMKKSRRLYRLLLFVCWKRRVFWSAWVVDTDVSIGRPGSFLGKWAIASGSLTSLRQVSSYCQQRGTNLYPPKSLPPKLHSGQETIRNDCIFWLASSKEQSMYLLLMISVIKSN